MRSIFATVVLLVSVTNSQLLNFGPGDLPSCAHNCQILKNAQTVCVPPAAPATGQQAYQSCFCQSAYLTTLHQSPAGICDASCPNTADTTQIQKWYLNLCNNGVGAASSTSSAVAAAVTSSAPNGVADAPATAATPAPASSSSSTGTDISGQKPSWWSQHGRWIAMIIVLVVAFAIIIVIGIIFKRRYNRKRNRATATPLPTTGWGPNVNPHSYPGPVEKNGNNTLDRQVSERKTPGTRLKKLVGR